MVYFIQGYIIAKILVKGGGDMTAGGKNEKLRRGKKGRKRREKNKKDKKGEKWEIRKEGKMHLRSKIQNFSHPVEGNSPSTNSPFPCRLFPCPNPNVVFVLTKNNNII